MAFNTHQPRDEDGKWTDGGTGGVANTMAYLKQHKDSPTVKGLVSGKSSGGTTKQLDDLDSELRDLEATHQDLPIKELKERRSAGINKATAIMNKLADAPKLDTAAFERAHQLILNFDRVGY